MLTRLLRHILVSFIPQFRNTPAAGGSSGGDDGGAFDGDINLTADEAAFINAQLDGDDDYQDLIEADKLASKGSQDQGGDGDGQGQGDDGDDGVGDGAGGDDGANDDPDDDGSGELADLDRKALKMAILEEELDITVTKEMTDEQIREAISKAREEANPHEEEDDDPDIEFEDNIIEGLKGEDLKAMSKTGRNAVAQFYQKTQSAQTEATTAKNELQKLLSDPVVRHRKELIDSGRSDFEYQVPTMTGDEIKKIMEEPDDNKAARLIESAARRMAKGYADNILINQDRQRQAKEIDNKGMNVLRDAGNFHPKLKIKETDISKIGPSHAEYGNFSQVHGEIINYCRERGLKYDAISKMNPQSLYAMVAIEKGWPIAANTQQRDLLIIADATKNALAPFLKNKDKGKANTGTMGGKSSSAAKMRGSMNKQGIDEAKLASDDTYHDRVLAMRPFDEKWVDKVSEMRERGEKKLQNKRK